MPVYKVLKKFGKFKRQYDLGATEAFDEFPREGRDRLIDDLIADGSISLIDAHKAFDHLPAPAIVMPETAAESVGGDKSPASAESIITRKRALLFE